MATDLIPHAAVDYIETMGRFSGKAGLHRIRALCAALGDPQKKLRFVHIAGTNGKGSTSMMIASSLSCAGLRTGLYTSPYIVQFYERIRVDGVLISDEDLNRLAERVHLAADSLTLPAGEQIGAFEFTTALAFLYFAEQNCDIVVLECGLGGRFDATNIIDPPEVVVITPISRDHMEVLGDTIAEIAAEKAAIIKTGSFVVCAVGQPVEALSVIAQACQQAGANWCSASVAHRVLRSDLQGNAFLYQGQGYALSLLGRHQIQNALTALHVLEALRERGFAIPTAAAVRGLAQAHLPGRLEKLADRPLLLLDGAHNAAGIIALGRTVDELLKMRRLHVVMGMVLDKEYEYCVRAMAHRADVFYAVAPDVPDRALCAQTLAALAKTQCDTVYDYPSAEEALSAALAAAEPQDCVMVCGSLYLVGEIKKSIHGKQKATE